MACTIFIMRSRSASLKAAALAGVMTATALPALAQQAAVPQGAIEEIFVTAQKRTESVQTVPISIVTLTGAQLERTNQSDLLAVAGRTPSLQFSSAGGEGQLYIRGVGSNLLAVGSDPSVAINLDGVYLGRPNMGLSQFLDVERVEVLRGPQGTLYGRNATGGSINLVSRQPSMQKWDGYLSAGTGSFNRAEVKAAAGGPISDMFSVRAAARFEKDDGYTKNLDPSGTKIDNNRIGTGRLILHAEPTDAVRATLTGDYSDFKNGNTSIRPNDTLGASQVQGALPTAFHETRNNVPTFMKWHTGGPTLNVEADLSDNVTLTSISAYKTFNMRFFFNTDGTEAAVTRTTETFNTNQFSQEIRLSSRNTERLEWIAGAYYFRENKKGALGLVRENLRNAVTGAPAASGVFIIPATGTTNAYAGFAQASYKLMDNLKLTAGIRYSDEKKDDFNKQVNIFVGPTATLSQIQSGLFGGLNPDNFPAALTRTDSKKWHAWTPKFGIDWQATPDVLVYASATRGFKSGGFNDYQPSNPAFNPEYIWSYEAGVKSDWLDRRLRVNLAAFYYDYKDLQVTSFLNSLTLVANAAKAKVKGLDLDVTAQPMPEFSIGASASVLDATYDAFLAPYGVCSPLVASDPACAGVTIGQPRRINASGNRLNNAPKFKGSMFGEYTWDLSNAGTVSLFGQVSYTGDIYFNAANDPNVRQKGYALVDARLSWKPASINVEVSLYGKNLTDKNYFHNIVQFTSASLTPPATALPNAGVVVTDTYSVGHALGYAAPGRTWGIEATYRF
jgi:iron complex outermembrane receptor protein